MRYFFDLAAKAALSHDLTNDPRHYWIGALGIRDDGKLVTTKNGVVVASSVPNDDYQRVALAHAETRLCRKLGKAGTVYVSRVAKADMSLVMARPCNICQSVLKGHDVKRVYYSINSSQYGMWNPFTNKDEIFSL